ncbi:hypothetical protein HDU91_000088 [Kappamyces sp. JEL0680]|nr:hypothetical protein HDU91_000088 [Kappamyces sp. JEL0680]
MSLYTFGWLLSGHKFSRQLSYMLVPCLIANISFQLVIITFNALALYYDWREDQTLFRSAIWFVDRYGLYTTMIQVALIDVEILSSFSVLDSRITAQRIERLRRAIIVWCVVLFTPGCIYTAVQIAGIRPSDAWKYSVLTVTELGSFVLTLYDNVQSVFLLYIIRQWSNERKKHNETVASNAMYVIACLVIQVTIDIAAVLMGLLGVSEPPNFNSMIVSLVGIHADVTIFSFFFNKTLVLGNKRVKITSPVPEVPPAPAIQDTVLLVQ